MFRRAFLTNQSFEHEKCNEYQHENDHRELNSLKIVDNANSILPSISLFYRMKRIMAFCLRFIYNCKNKNKFTGPITANEFEPAELAIIKIVQHEALNDEFKTLRNSRQVHHSSRFVKLSPCIENGWLRVGGRLRNANLPFDSEHQILLPHSFCL